MTPFSLEIIHTRRLHAHVQSQMCPHVCCQIYKSTRYQVCKVATPSRKPQDSGPYQPVSTSTHVQSRAMPHVAAPRCSVPSQYIPHRMRPNELPQNTLSINTPLGDDVCNDSISVECPPPVDACSQRATKRDSAHQRHTRSVQSSSCAEGGFFSKAQSVSVHGLQPKRVVLQRHCSHPLSSRCRSVLSAIRTATRCSSAFVFDMLQEPRSTRAFEVC